MLEKASRCELIAAVAGDQMPSDTRESWLSRAARKGGLSYRQVKSIFYGEISNPKHPAVRLMRLAAGDNARREAKQLANTFNHIAGGGGLRIADADFHCHTIAALIRAARLLGGEDSTRDIDQK